MFFWGILGSANGRARHAKRTERSFGEQLSPQRGTEAEHQWGARGRSPRKFLKNIGVLEDLRAILSIETSSWKSANGRAKQGFGELSARGLMAERSEALASEARKACRALGRQTAGVWGRSPQKFLKNKGVLEALRAILSIETSTKLMSNFHEK